MIFCITGIDCSGKSTLINNLKKKLTNVIFWKKDYKPGLEGKIQAGYELRNHYLANNNVITERVPYIEDIVYSEILEGNRSLFDNNINYLKELKDYVIIRLTADKNILKERLKARGDNYINEDQLDLIQAKYDDVLSLLNNVVTIDTTNIGEKELANIVYKYIKDKSAMKIGYILPINAIKLIKGKPFHMCLAHLMKQNKDYKEFYKQEVKNGSYVLMDNGEYERSILTNEQLINLYNEVQPSEIVLPDSIADTELSIMKTINGYHEIKSKLNYKPSYLIVPHGNNIRETCENLKSILNNLKPDREDIFNIGIGKLLISGESRCELVERIDAILNEYLFTINSKIHLLGCIESLEEMKRIYKSCWRVRSFDSSLPSIFTFKNELISKTAVRPKIEMDWNRADIDSKLLKKNIKEMEKIINE